MVVPNHMKLVQQLVRCLACYLTQVCFLEPYMGLDPSKNDSLNAEAEIILEHHRSGPKPKTLTNK